MHRNVRKFHANVENEVQTDRTSLCVPQMISRGKMVSYNDQEPTLRFPTWMTNTDQEPDWTPTNCRQIGQLSTKNTKVHNVWSAHTIGSQIACSTCALKCLFMTWNLPARNVKFWSRRFRKYLWKCGKTWVLHSAPIFPEADRLDLIRCASRSLSFVWSRRYSIFRPDVVGT